MMGCAGYNYGSVSAYVRGGDRGEGACDGHGGLLGGEWVSQAPAREGVAWDACERDGRGGGPIGIGIGSGRSMCADRRSGCGGLLRKALWLGEGEGRVTCCPGSGLRYGRQHEHMDAVEVNDVLGPPSESETLHVYVHSTVVYLGLCDGRLWSRRARREQYCEGAYLHAVRRCCVWSTTAQGRRRRLFND
ncbi:hypothetical protein GY45DRAFT_781129 [Cubamyces sp. BRFM 1775]|nr:hypothetical protein GY45DRAFT_781129 [Cubamyces sp. BRFM 1775]